MFYFCPISDTRTVDVYWWTTISKHAKDAKTRGVAATLDSEVGVHIEITKLSTFVGSDVPGFHCNRTGVCSVFRHCRRKLLRSSAGLQLLCLFFNLLAKLITFMTFAAINSLISENDTIDILPETFKKNDLYISWWWTSLTTTTSVCCFLFLFSICSYCCYFIHCF